MQPKKKKKSKLNKIKIKKKKQKDTNSNRKLIKPIAKNFYHKKYTYKTTKVSLKKVNKTYLSLRLCPTLIMSPISATSSDVSSQQTCTLATKSYKVPTYYISVVLMSMELRLRSRQLNRRKPQGKFAILTLKSTQMYIDGLTLDSIILVAPVLNGTLEWYKKYSWMFTSKAK